MFPNLDFDCAVRTLLARLVDELLARLVLRQPLLQILEARVAGKGQMVSLVAIGAESVVASVTVSVLG